MSSLSSSGLSLRCSSLFALSVDLRIDGELLTDSVQLITGRVELTVEVTGLAIKSTLLEFATLFASVVDTGKSLELLPEPGATTVEIEMNLLESNCLKTQFLV